jgi:hypothetical protein
VIHRRIGVLEQSLRINAVVRAQTDAYAGRNVYIEAREMDGHGNLAEDLTRDELCILRAGNILDE